jgi:hypothetical protein
MNTFCLILIFLILYMVYYDSIKESFAVMGPNTSQVSFSQNTRDQARGCILDKYPSGEFYRYRDPDRFLQEKRDFFDHEAQCWKYAAGSNPQIPKHYAKENQQQYFSSMLNDEPLIENYISHPRLIAQRNPWDTGVRNEPSFLIRNASGLSVPELTQRTLGCQCGQ